MYLIIRNQKRIIIKSLLIQTKFEHINFEFNLEKDNYPLISELFIFDTHFSCKELKKIKLILNDLNIKIEKIYSNSREIILSAKYLKINCEFNLNFSSLLFSNNALQTSTEDKSFFGTIRSGDKLSSNGHLFIIGDVNPGAQLSAKKNIYVWGKLCGKAFAGDSGNNEAIISSLYLNPLQIRINQTVAIGPKEKPKNHYPEIALIERGKILIKPLIIK